MAGKSSPRRNERAETDESKEVFTLGVSGNMLLKHEIDKHLALVLFSNVLNGFSLTTPGINTPALVVLVVVIAVCGSCCGIHLAFAVDNETIANVVVFMSDFAHMYKEKVA